MRISNKKKLLISLTFVSFLLLCLFTFLQKAEKRVQVDYTVYSQNGIVSYAYGDFDTQDVQDQQKVLQALDGLSDLYGFKDVYSELRLNKIFRQANGYIYSFDQYYKDCYVFPRGIKVSVDAGNKIDSISGNYLAAINPKNSIQLTKKEASDRALSFGGSQIFGCKLIIYAAEKQEPLYAYEVSTDYSGLTDFYVDAQSGILIDTLGQTRNANQPYQSEQIDYYIKNVPLNIMYDTTTHTYTLADGYRNINMRYATLQDDTDGMLFKNSTGIFDNKIAVSALSNLIRVFDFYTDKENIGVSLLGVDGSVQTDKFGKAAENGEKQVNAIIYIGTGYDNAFCLPNYPDQTYTTLGFGDARNFAVALEVCGHEYQHAITRNTANLVYSNASGALDEAISDLFGFLIKGVPMSDDSFWVVGDGIPDEQGKAGNGIIRSAINPTQYSDGRADMDSSAPFCYKANSHDTHLPKCDKGGVHLNSTIITHSVYQMYQYSVLHNVASFNNQNLGKMLYSTLQKMSRDCGWREFADLFSVAPRMLGLGSAQTSALTRCIEYGFNYTGIYNNLDFEHSTIEFRLEGGYQGQPPAAITGAVGDEFIIPASDIVKSGYEFVGWSQTIGKENISDEIYYADVSYQIPFYDMVLYPVALPPPPEYCFVRFLNYDGKVIHSAEVQTKTAADFPADIPARPDSLFYFYKFAGWRADGIVVDADFIVSQSTDFTAYFDKRLKFSAVIVIAATVVFAAGTAITIVYFVRRKKRSKP